MEMTEENLHFMEEIRHCKTFPFMEKEKEVTIVW